MYIYIYIYEYITSYFVYAFRHFSSSIYSTRSSYDGGIERRHRNVGAEADSSEVVEAAGPLCTPAPETSAPPLPGTEVKVGSVPDAPAVEASPRAEAAYTKLYLYIYSYVYIYIYIFTYLNK